MPFVCEPCRPVYNLVQRKKRAGEPTNLAFTPCDDCRAAQRAWRAANPRASRAKHPTEPDDMMVQRLLYGPDPAAIRVERREAAEFLLRRGHDMSHEIAARVGLSRRSIERIAAELGLNNPRPRAEVELGASETRAQIWQLMCRGNSIRGAARSIGVTAGTADGHVKKLREIGVL